MEAAEECPGEYIFTPPKAWKRHPPLKAWKRIVRTRSHRPAERFRAMLCAPGTHSPGRNTHPRAPPCSGLPDHRTYPCPVAARSHFRSDDRELFRLAVPALGALVAEPLYVLADTAVVGHLGTAPLAGLGVASGFLMFGYGLCVFWPTERRPPWPG